MNGTLNPNFVLAAVIAILLLAVGAVIAIGAFITTNSTENIGIVIALIAPTVVSLLALLRTDQTHAESVKTNDTLNGGVSKLLDKKSAEWDKAQSEKDVA